MKRIGIDVGGTHTDAVLMNGMDVLAAVKTKTTRDVTQGIEKAILKLLGKANCSPASIQAVMLGTTHFTNAIIEAKNLAPIAAIRAGLPATKALPPMIDWPARLTKVLGDATYLCHGGCEFDGRPISLIDKNEIQHIAVDIRQRKINSIAITSVFSPMNASCEEDIAALLAAELPDCYFSLSSKMGGPGLLYRENAAILNACLREMANGMLGNLKSMMNANGMPCPLYISQNDGTLMSAEYARDYPIMTFSSGPTNSMRGAAYLSSQKNCIVVDIGGTTTDVGLIINGFPQEAPFETEIGGVRTNFRMPHLLSIGLGGGSRIKCEDQLEIGPESTGYNLKQDALIFGGNVLTATDIAVAANHIDLGNRAAVSHLDESLITSVLDLAEKNILDAIDKIKISKTEYPVVIVGGGSILINEKSSAFSQLIKPEYHAVANAIGTAIAKISGEVDKIVDISSLSRKEVIELAKQEAIKKARAAGAMPGSIEIVDVEEIPLTYLSGTTLRLRVKAVGELL